VYYIGATRAEARLSYFNLSAVSELTFQRDDKRVGIGERALATCTEIKEAFSFFKL